MDADKRLTGFVPAFRDVADWRAVYRRERAADNRRVVRQVTWECLTDANQRLLVEVTETESAKAARDAVDDAVLEKSIGLERGPDRFGPWSFVYPLAKPCSVNFAWENLAIWVFSCGRKQESVEDWVDRILDELRRYS